VTLNRLDEDDLPVRGYSSRRSEADNSDREISLGTPTILGIFFALALVCACFFGFGYTMGRKSAQSSPSSPDSVAASNPNATKPAAGSAANRPATPALQPADTTPAATPAVQTATVPLPPPATPKNAPNPADGMIVGDKFPPPTTQPATSNQQSAASFIVQVAAVSSQDVADILTSSLQKKGYTVTVHHEPQDKLLHVQIGPFSDRKQAVAMQQRVLADGFNAIVK
jgi:DedD protein